MLTRNPIVKFLEGFILGPLKRYQKQLMIRTQLGFVPGCSIDHCKERLLKKLDLNKQSHTNTILTFIDFSSAYDKVDRSKLYAFI
jgi:hypothetical protein